jgi:UDP-4-amino-4-deoxy-L-arabinose formyltransferase/UDP-glucuronic acid dehydrogenase (UDP-4-keto-hexauronic acid decarboxylating)
MARSLRVLLIAEDAAGVQTLRMLAGSPHEVVAVMTGGAGGRSEGSSVAGIASRLGYRLWPARQLKETGFAEMIRREQVDLLLNVHSLCVLPSDVVAAPRIGSFNLHPGPLPRYAGLNAPSWAIYNGELTHAVTLHWMDSGIDTGPIAYQTELTIEEEDTGLTLSAKCVRAGLPQIRELLEAAIAGTIPRQPQPNVDRRYCGREVPHEGRLRWTDSAAQVVNFVRACDYRPFTSPWGYPRACLAGRDVSVLKAVRTGERSKAQAGTIGWREGSDVLVAARDEWVGVRRVQVGAHGLAAAEVLRLGDRFLVHPSSWESASATA